jgi:hypothetical protein
MPGIKPKLHIVVLPNRRHFHADPDPSWLRPSGLPVELVSVSSGQVLALGVTNSKGITDFSPELEVGNYQIQIPGHHLHAAADLKLIQADNRRTVEVRMAPPEGECLVALHLTEEPAGTPLAGATVSYTGTDGRARSAHSLPDGHVLIAGPEGEIALNFAPVTTNDGKRLITRHPSVSLTATPSRVTPYIAIPYYEAIQISVEATVNTPAGSAPLTGCSVTVNYWGSKDAARFSETKTLAAGEATLGFEYTDPGVYDVTVTQPPTFQGFALTNPPPPQVPQALDRGDQVVLQAPFDIAPQENVDIVVKTPQNQPLVSPGVEIDILGSQGSSFSHEQSVAQTDTPYTVAVPNDALIFRIPSTSTPCVKAITGDIPVELAVPDQPVVVPGTNIIELAYVHSITGRAVDEHGQAAPGATVAILDENQGRIAIVAADEQGNFVVGLRECGTYYLSQHPEVGAVGIRERVEVHSNGVALVRVYKGQGGAGAGGAGGEALTDLAAYPVLTEEISTVGPPAPATGAGPAAGGPGAGYGQTVDQVMRDVLGWRPSGDVAGFQAALSGAFQLRQVEGHTEWSWQQRGYAVQADMGALTGAQASIYARAKSALDQMLPLLAGLTALNPSLYAPQDLEAIRTVITAELQELVNELALEGGPRIRRVDELFRLLTGESRRSRNRNPDAVQGQLGTLRDRFGLTVANVDTVDEERIVTNFRVVVELVLTLQESWESDRKLLSVLDSNTSLGTILIWLSRGLEAVCESVDDLTFALDSVFVDAAQRQVIQLNFSGITLDHLPELPLWKGKTVQPNYSFPGKQAPILLSDLLDWVVRASRDEGPKIVQDAGKDGVLAFSPILNELRILIHATRKLTHSHQGATLPDGVRTPRVRRALEVLAAQLDEAANLAALVKRDAPPEITGVTVPPGWSRKLPAPVQVTFAGTNFRRHALAFLFAANREDIPEIARPIHFTNPGTATATFRIPRIEDAGGRLDWQVMLTNEDGTSTEPVALPLP